MPPVAALAAMSRHDSRPALPPQDVSALRALTYGTYDLFHVGHVNLFRPIKERSAHLIVAVSTDEFNAVKGKQSVMSFADRCALVGDDRVVGQRGCAERPGFAV